MTTITALNVRLAMDVSNFSEGANLAKGEVTRVSAIMRQSVPPAEKYKQELELLNRTFSEAGKQSTQYANALDFLAKKYQQGKYSAEEMAKAEAAVTAASTAAAEAAKRQKDETARLAEIEKQRQAVLEKGRQLTQALQTAEEAYWQKVNQFKELRRAGAITEETYARALQQSRKTLEEARASTDTAVAAAKRLKEEKARLAEAEKAHQAVMERGRQLTQSVEKAQESHNRRIREYRQLLQAGAIDQETFRRAAEKSNQTLKQSQASAATAMSAIKGMAAAYISFQTASKALDLASQIEDATIAFETLTGSARDGQLLFQQIRQLDKETPITFGNATAAAKTMLSFGVAVQDVEKNLKMLSDVTGGNNERFKNLSLAFAQMSSAGRLMGQDLLQMINAGFNPLQQISRRTGESMIDLKKRMEDGGISADEVRQAFADATSEGGMFNGMTDRLSQTVGGQLNIALSDLEQKLAAAGAAMGPLIMQVLDVFQKLKPILDGLVWVIAKVSEGLGYVLAIAKDVINSIATMSIDETETNKFLDQLEQRKREAEEAAKQGVDREFENRRNQENAAAVAAKKAEDEKAAAKAKALEAQRKAAQDAWEQQQKMIQKEKEARLRAIEEARRAQQRAAEEAEQRFQRDLETARQAAIDYFQQKEERNRQRREDVSRGPGAGMEAGSAEAAKFSADLVNKQIGAAAVPDKPTPGEHEIAIQAMYIFREQKAANEKHDRQLQLLDDLVREAKDNGFRRIR